MISAGRRKTIRILVAEDDLEDQMLLSDAFEYVHHKIEFVESGKLLEAELEDNHFPDIILLDLFMPPNSGLETLKHLKAHPDWRHIPVIIYSNFDDDEFVNEAYALGATSFISKPVTFEELVDEMRKLVTYWENTVTLSGMSISRHRKASSYAA
ncbi:MAG: response regulator [Cohaesibacteraceae bacterium]|nr:response regulator [Cohaesibacteraceae bacterium]